MFYILVKQCQVYRQVLFRVSCTDSNRGAEIFHALPHHPFRATARYCNCL